MTTPEMPNKRTICTAIQAALKAANQTREPWGNTWATGVLAALLWRAREAEDTALLQDILCEAGSVARVALHGTPGYVHVYRLDALNVAAFMADTRVQAPCECDLCARRRQREQEASAT